MTIADVAMSMVVTALVLNIWLYVQMRRTYDKLRRLEMADVAKHKKSPETAVVNAAYQLHAQGLFTDEELAAALDAIRAQAGLPPLTDTDARNALRLPVAPVGTWQPRFPQVGTDSSRGPSLRLPVTPIGTWRKP